MADEATRYEAIVDYQDGTAAISRFHSCVDSVKWAVDLCMAGAGAKGYRIWDEKAGRLLQKKEYLP